VLARISDPDLFARPIVITNADFRFVVAEYLCEKCGADVQEVARGPRSCRAESHQRRIAGRPDQLQSAPLRDRAPSIILTGFAAAQVRARSWL
jgi:Helix-turn-helix domain of resolvase